jgi:hypothetical protein
VERFFALIPTLHGEFPSAFTVRFVLSEIYLNALRKQSSYITWGLETRKERF